MDGEEEQQSDRSSSSENNRKSWELDELNQQEGSSDGSGSEEEGNVRENGHDESYGTSEHDEKEIGLGHTNQEVNGYSTPSRSSSANSGRRDEYSNGIISPRVPNCNEQLGLTDWIEKVKNNLKAEHRALKQAEFKDYQNLNELKESLKDTVRMCKEHDDHLTVLCTGMGDIRGILKELNNTIDKKLSQEGLKGWISESTDYDTGE